MGRVFPLRLHHTKQNGVIISHALCMIFLLINPRIKCSFFDSYSVCDPLKPPDSFLAKSYLASFSLFCNLGIGFILPQGRRMKYVLVFVEFYLVNFRSFLQFTTIILNYCLLKGFLILFQFDVICIFYKCTFYCIIHVINKVLNRPCSGKTCAKPYLRCSPNIYEYFL